MLLFFLFFFLFFSAFMSSAEIALFSLSSFTLRAYKEDAHPRKRLVARLLERPKELLVTILIVNIFSSILIQNIVASLLSRFSSWLLNVAIPTILIIFIAEIFPKSIALANNTYIAQKVVGVIAFLERFLGPLRWILTWVTSIVSRFLFFFLKKEKPLSIEELEFVLEKSKNEGTLQKEESDFIAHYLELKDLVAKEMMRKKNDLFFFDIHQDLTALSSLFFEHHLSCLLVCDNNIDHPLGTLSFQRFFLGEGQFHTTMDLKKYLEKPFYVPESMNGWLLFHELRRRKENFAVVVDEYGSIVGMVMIEDLIGSLLADESEEKNFTRLSEDVIIANGNLELEEFSQIFGVDLMAKSSIITLGGWLTEMLENIPPAGTKYVTDDFLFYVLESHPTHIQRIYVRHLKPLPKERR